MITLAALPINARGIIQYIDTDPITKAHLISIGLTKGTKFKVKPNDLSDNLVVIQPMGTEYFIQVTKKQALTVLVFPI